MNLFLLIVVGLLLIVIGYLLITTMQLRERIRPIIDVEQEASRLKAELASNLKDIEKQMQARQQDMDRIKKEYNRSKSIYDRLNEEVTLLEESLEDMSFGLYKPHHDYEDPEQFKRALDKIYEEKKSLIKNSRAVSCPQNWTVNGSLKEGKKMVRQESKLMLRAFNGEVDAALAKVTWNNALKMEERIKKSFDAINDLGSVHQMSIVRDYLNLSLKELRLTHELEAKKQAIKEEQREIREQMRQEELAQREFEKAKRTAEAEEARYQRALERARQELETARADEMNVIKGTIDSLEERLAEAQAKLDRAVSMAQLTKSGHVYVISNIGSFGEDVFKIGMTRRLDPTERVYELGSASVPFPYDIHAMIYSVDAPGLEAAFHREFAHRRVNMVNTRKEFFRVELEELESFAKAHKADIEFTKLAEAREFRQTMALLSPAKEERAQQSSKEEPVRFPASLFEEEFETVN